VFVQADLFGDAGGDDAARVYSVREINEVVRAVLDDGFDAVTIEGEISNARLQSSGHWYFTLKDDMAQLPVVLFRADAAPLRFQPENGLAVRATGRLSLYVPQGKFQLVARRLVPVGQGALELAFRQLRDRLQAEGLFDAARKRPLPRYPRRIALVTSPSGAAVRDVLTTLAARWPLAEAFVVPVSVQGDAAPGEIIRALAFVNRLRAADVIIVARGGGSLEDLWAFNDEGVARAIRASRLPVVSGVGHETDFTIADFVSDRRAATPTAAAMLVVPHRDEVRGVLRTHDGRLARALRRRLELPRQRLEALLRSYGMRRMPGLVPEAMQSLDARLERLAPALERRLEQHAARWAAVVAQLQALGPRRVLERGYTYCVDATHGQVVGRAAAAHPGQSIVVHFADGSLEGTLHGVAEANASVPIAGTPAASERRARRAPRLEVS
jgi:exodeoxyribonuclease VII large subunit